MTLGSRSQSGEKNMVCDDFLLTHCMVHLLIWHFILGPVVYLNVLGADIVLFNSLKAAVDVLDRQGSKCASRPHNIVVNEMLSGDMFFGFLPDNERFVLRDPHSFKQ